MQRVLAMPADDADAEVFFLTALPMRLSRPLLRALRQARPLPRGTALMAGRGLFSGYLVGGGLAHKRATLDRLAAGRPDTSGS